VAGEASGDQLGAALIRAIRLQVPDARFVGIGGPLMKSEGMDCWWDTSELSVMGLFEVISHLPRLVKLRRRLLARLLSTKPDVFVGIDAPDFNLGVQKRLRKHGIRVIQYVSPTVWAWRQGRVKSIARATERVMCLFPFEPDYYRDQNIAADYTGHPMADQIPMQVESEPARAALDVSSYPKLVALLPGSRMSEVEKLSLPMLEAAAILTKKYPGAGFLVPAASAEIKAYFQAALEGFSTVDCRILDGQSRDAIAAADVVICASGTATLEVMLINRPMVVCYRLAAMTHWLAMSFKLVKSRFFSLPNILSSQQLVPELLQDQVTGNHLAEEVSRWLDQEERRDRLRLHFNQLHELLRKDAASSAARVVLDHVSTPRQPAS
jgi:lipid-A-disaccharide synthase